jgi:tetratricopeptide (TPR) repeat protein
VVLNKARTSKWTKALIIFMIVALVTLFMYQGVAGIIELFQQPTAQPASTTTESVASVEQRHKPTVTALQGLLTSNPTSYTIQVSLANEYYNWADELSRPLKGQSQVTTAAWQMSLQQWALAKTAYDAATKMTKQFDPSIQTDRSYATVQATNDATAAIKIVSEVIKKDPKFAQAWAHIGLYYEAAGKTALALSAYQKYLALDPKGSNAASIKQRVTELAGSTATTKTPITTTKP